MTKAQIVIIGIACTISIGLFFLPRSPAHGKNQSIQDTTKVYPALTLNNVLTEICKQEIKEPLIVLKQCIIETKWLQCNNCSMDVNNIFGFGWNGKTYFKYNHWTESVAAYKKWQDKYLKVNEDYYQFLQRIGYAEDKSYISKLKSIGL